MSEIDTEDLIAVHARGLIKELQRNGFNPDPLLGRLRELVDTYGRSNVERRLEALEKAIRSLQK